MGSVKMRCYLSGMPELRLGLNDKVLFENTGSKFVRQSEIIIIIIIITIIIIFLKFMTYFLTYSNYYIYRLKFII